MAIGPDDILRDANGNPTRQTERGTSNITHYLFDEENRLACVHKGTQVLRWPRLFGQIFCFDKWIVCRG